MMSQPKRKPLPEPSLNGETSWIFDLDNTLYPERCNLFAGIDKKMGAYISRLLEVDLAEAKRVQKDYFLRYGTTLRGLIEQHGVDAREFLDFVHDIDVSPLEEDPELNATLGALSGRKYVFTNGSTRYAQKVLNRLGLDEVVDGVFDIAHANFMPKPNAAAYQAFVDHFEVDPASAVMVEDMARNLTPAYKMGMTTVWLKTASPWGEIGYNPAHIHYEIEDLGDWLKTVTGPARG